MIDELLSDVIVESSLPVNISGMTPNQTVGAVTIPQATQVVTTSNFLSLIASTSDAINTKRQRRTINRSLKGEKPKCIEHAVGPDRVLLEANFRRYYFEHGLNKSIMYDTFIKFLRELKITENFQAKKHRGHWNADEKSLIIARYEEAQKDTAYFDNKARFWTDYLGEDEKMPDLKTFSKWVNDANPNRPVHKKAKTNIKIPSRPTLLQSTGNFVGSELSLGIFSGHNISSAFTR